MGRAMDSDADLVHSVEAWLSHADDLDLLPAALELDRIREQLAPSGPFDRLRSARLHLLTGNLAAAEQSLALAPDSPGPARLIHAGAAAARGDDQAYRWLQHALAESTDEGSAPIEAYQMTAVAAEHRSDFRLADALWCELTLDQGIWTPLTTARTVAAVISRRAGSSVRDQARLFAESAETLEQGLVPLVSDPQPALNAAHLLIRRGDPAGAALLLQAVDHRYGPDDKIVQVQRLHRELLLKNGTDRRLSWAIGLRRLSTWRYNYVLHIVMAAAIAFAAGVFLAALYTNSQLDPAGDFQGSAGGLGSVWFVAVLGLPILAGRGAASYMRRFPQSLKTRPGPIRRAPEPFCSCLTSTLIQGAQAGPYAREHLLRSPFEREDPKLNPLRGRTFRCPDTQVPWLAIPDAHSPAILLRGAAPGLTIEPDQGPTGLYL